MFELTAFQRDMLILISGTEKLNGLDIRKRLEPIREEEINHGRLYPNLDTLVQEGLIEKGELDKRTNYYQLTEKGYEAITEYRHWVNREFNSETPARSPEYAK